MMIAHVLMTIVAHFDINDNIHSDNVHVDNNNACSDNKNMCSDDNNITCSDDNNNNMFDDHNGMRSDDNNGIVMTHDGNSYHPTHKVQSKTQVGLRFDSSTHGASETVDLCALDMPNG